MTNITNFVFYELENLYEQLIEYVDSVTGIIYFHLLEEVELISTNRNMAIIKNRIKLLQILRDKSAHLFHSLDESTDEVSQYLIKTLDKLPITYIQILYKGEMVSIRYYSSVDNTKESVQQIIDRMIEILQNIDRDKVEIF